MKTYIVWLLVSLSYQGDLNVLTYHKSKETCDETKKSIKDSFDDFQKPRIICVESEIVK